ncbi:MAG: hypothetical protein N5P05_001366 [Chroococcopsis gigantea SAG 12.99]|nr:hypothetical protein [Chlorogloea purpurea SAG 13.99]MDV2999760.1 hypothetical protein [Chroococcopsis gigantea SAG 12.99]
MTNNPNFIQFVEDAARTFRNNLDYLTPGVQRMVEQGTEKIGEFVAPIADNPLIRTATKIPGLSWVMAGIGQVDIEKVDAEVNALRQSYPSESHQELAERVIRETTWNGGRIGVITNLIPPFAVSLFAIDVAAISALQAEMIYRIAAIHGFSPYEKTRRGEVFGIWLLSIGGSGVIKSGLSILEILPGIGPLIGGTTNATLLYSLGIIACNYYSAKVKNPPSIDVM